MSARDREAGTARKHERVRDHRDPGVAWYWDEPGAEEWGIEVVCGGASAQAYDADQAVAAARQLCEDAWAANPAQGFRPTVTFKVGDLIVATSTEEALRA